MNTRLQVEHPVTEETTGLDLVELQLDGRRRRSPGRRTACRPRAFDRGPALCRRSRARLAAAGRPGAHASTCRRCAPNSARWDTRTGIRLDSGIVDGSVVSIHYDPMLAKVISYAPTRRQVGAGARRRAGPRPVHGLRTNRELLVNVLRHPAFLDGATDTAFFDTHGLAELSAPLADAATVRLSAIAAALADAADNRATAGVFGSLPSGWRNLASGYQVKTYRDDTDTEHRVEYRFTRTGLALPDDPTVQLVSASSHEVVLADTAGWRAASQLHGHGHDIYVDSARGPVHLVALPRFPEPGSAVEQGSLVAPMPGNVIRLGAASRRHRHRRPAADLAGGDEDGAHHHRADRRRARRTQRRDRPTSRSRRRPGASGSASRSQQKENHHDRHQLHRERRPPGAAQGGVRMGVQLRQRVLPEEGPRPGAHHRIVVRGRQTRLPRGEPARGVRRWRRRHVRAVAGDGGNGRRRQRAAADGGLARHQRHHHQQVRHRGAEEALGSRPSPTAP